MGANTGTNGDGLMLAIAVYVSAIVIANLMVSFFGPWVSPINAFVLIGLDLSLRDYFQEKWRGNMMPLKMGLLIFGSGAISYALDQSSGSIAAASVVAFAFSNSFNTILYYLLGNRPYLIKSNVSNILGAIIDSVVFPTIAFGALLPEIVMLQFFAKMFGGFLWSLILNRKLARDKAA